MDRRKFIDRRSRDSRCARVAAGYSPQAEESAKRPPNVLFIMPDEWRGQALGCMGNPDVQTPHLDQLASEGFCSGRRSRTRRYAARRERPSSPAPIPAAMECWPTISG